MTAPELQIIIPTKDMRSISLESSTTIGRSEHNQLAFPDDLLISRQHALIRQQGPNEYVLIDLGSSNGTYLNSQLIIAPTALAHGDEILVGSVLLKFLFPEQIKMLDERSENMDGIETRTMFGIRVAQVTILVCDIRNFTTLSEMISAEDLARFLGGWFREASQLVFANGGVVDKYIGDAFMAYWPTVRSDPKEGSNAALSTAKELLALANRMPLPKKIDFAFKIGIGLHEGVVASGNVGSSSQRDSSIMGDTVNTAFRLESECKRTGYELLISGEVYERIGRAKEFDSLGLVEFKGKTTKVALFGLKRP
jgi:adenylate cyclase